MKLQTQVPIVSSPHPIGYPSEILLLGSCFANHIGSKLAYYKFKTTLNPFGILFHPISIAHLVERALKDQKFQEEELFLHQEQWHSFEVHSELSRNSKEELLHTLNKQLELFQQKISSCTHLILTLGTAWGYEQKVNGKWVANCHKVPQKEFKKVLSSSSEVVNSLTALITNIRQINPEIALYFTISPVRHLKDGFVENQRSKAHLVAAVHQLLQAMPGQKLYYFPAYELMMDELRDYRFYETDMVHPNALAVDYIWEKFRGSCILNEALGTMETVSEVQKGLAHKAFNPASKQHQEFEKTLQLKIRDLTKCYPHIHF
ncbi:GSCFA domain-containing protein [Muriicola sp.]|uniref:GSCFA domain-containing protein n=1 Tax=Muriicola sp. TaxID=2020856 RepID=UPI003C7236C9